ncbi:MAG: hypothetical protein K9K76_11900 [Halanaerobiales bacterium]|nr:hypothetical protein [Halanaerobiales bacterium]
MNKNKEPYPNEYEEVDLRELIMTLWNGKWIIISLFIVAVFVTAFYSMFMIEPTYEGKASLLIMPPTYTTSLDVSTLPVNTYENIALTDTIKQDIINELDLTKSDGSSYTVENLENMMVLEVKTREIEDDSENKYPFLVMKVRSSDPKLSSKIANTWANKFMKTSKEIRKGEVQEVTGVIIEQFEDTDKKLSIAREELKDFEKENRLSLKNSKLEIMTDKLSDYEDKLITLKTNLGSEKNKYKDILAQLDKLEKDGEWKGELSKNNLENKELMTNTSNYLLMQERLLEFRKNNNLDILSQEIDTKELLIKKYQENQAEIEDELNNLINENKEINNLLEAEDSRWKLKRSLSNNAFWNNILDEEQIEILKDLTLTDEIVNPIFQNLKTKYSNSKISIESIPVQIQYYERKIKEEKEKLDNLKSELVEKEQKEEKLVSDLNNYKKIYDNEASIYRSLIADKLESEMKIDSLTAQIDFYDSKVDELESDIKLLQDEIWEAEIRKKELSQRVTDIQNTYIRLSEKVEEARLTEAQRTSDVKFIARAVPPNQSIGSNTKLNIVIAGVLALMLGVFIVAFKNMMATDEVN